MGSDPQAVEDLYTKIALDNKLVTRFQVRKAAEELDVVIKDGGQSSLGDVMVKLGFLSERQHQSVVNACRYREQRDFDKRFGRQCLRMELLEQDDIEKALEVQKDGYQQNGKVDPLADILVQLKKLSQKQVDEVKKGIDDRDKAKARTGKGALAQSGGTPALAGGGRALVDPPTSSIPVRTPPSKGKASDDDEDDLTDVDLDDVDLDDGDLDVDEDDLKDVDLDDEDLDADLDEDLKDIDLDEDLDDDASPDLEIDPKKLDLDQKDDDAGEDEADLAEEVSEIGSDVELDEEDLAALDRMDSGDEVEGEGAWAADAFDDRPLSQRPASERLKKKSEKPAEKSERPADKSDRTEKPRSPVAPKPSVPQPPAAATAAAAITSGRLKPPAGATKAESPKNDAPKNDAAKNDAAKSAAAKNDAAKADAARAESTATPRARPLPDLRGKKPAAEKPVEKAPEKPVPDLAATASSPFQSTDESDPAAPAPPAVAAIPGGDVFDSEITSGSSDDASAVVSPPAKTAFEDADPLTASEVGRIIDVGKKPLAEESDSGEVALRDRLRQSARRLEEAMAETDSKRGASARGKPASAASSSSTPDATAAPAAAAAPSTASPATASAPKAAANGTGLDLSDPRVRRAFDKAMEAAWKVFVQELEG